MTKKFAMLAAIAAALLVAQGSLAQVNERVHEATEYANTTDRARAEIFAERAADWRNGALVYQVIVDRFAPAADLEAKAHLYPAPKRLRTWEEVPTGGTFNEEVQVWSHEIDFWGGDLESLRGRLGYIQDLGVDVLYLNPIHLAYTNHKYDAQDYFAVSPEYGTREDVGDLAAALHERGMRLMLDGVLNHMGRTSPKFQAALADPESDEAEWFNVGSDYEMGYRGWYDVANLPELNLESEDVRDRLWNDRDSVIQGYLREEKIDGWRLDVAFDIGFAYLEELTEAAHRAREKSLIIGEIWNYPEQWFPAVDGVMNMTARELILRTVRNEVPADHASELMAQMIEDAGLENMLKSWIILDNHDTPRLRTVLEEREQQKLAQILQFTIPGSPCIYYGVELGMEGGNDPEMRAPMRWDLVEDDNEFLSWMRTLISLRQSSPALRYGDYRHLESRNALAFVRTTDRVEDTTVVVANPSSMTVRETILTRDSKLMNYQKLRDQLGSGVELTVLSGLLDFEIPPQTAWVLQPVISDTIEYNAYKRVQ